MDRQRWHQVVGALFWVLLVLMWALILQQGKAPRAAVVESLVAIAVLAAAVALVTSWWVRHNTRIYQRKGPRQAGPVLAPVTDRDRLGRAVVWHVADGPAGAVSAGHLVVELVGEEKVYRGGDG